MGFIEHFVPLQDRSALLNAKPRLAWPEPDFERRTGLQMRL